MKNTAVVILPALLLLASFSALGCSSASGAGPSETVAPVLEGTYEASGPGTISEISFYDGTSYVLWRTPCADGSGTACLEDGTFSLNAEATVLSLADVETGETTTLPFQVLVMTPASLEAPTANEIGGLTMGASGLASTGANLSGQVQSAVLDGQTVALAPATPVALVSSSPCVFTRGFTGSPSGVLSQVTQQIQSKGGTVTGNAQSGQFSVSGVTGTYSVNGSNITVNVSKMPWYASCSAVMNAMSGS